MRQPCISCGRDTAPGTRLYAARKLGRDRATATVGPLCYACQPGSAAPGADQSIPLSGRFAVVDGPGGYPG